MEPLAAFSEGEWGSLSGLYTNEEADFMAEFLGNCQFPNDIDGHHESATMNLSDCVLFPSSSSQESYYFSSMPMDFCLGEECLRKENQPKNESRMQIPEPGPEIKIINDLSENSKKRSRGRIDKNKKISRLLKNLKTVSPSNNDQEDSNNGGPVRQTLSNGCSDDDNLNASWEPNGGETLSLIRKGNAAFNLNGKTRANRGSATDPQSLYARKRRETINERLRILQKLIPNGTQVDLSTMLEEAVQYVKFLQLQIKLLSSDDLWMYAPIAYNGKNIGLDLKAFVPW